MTKVLQSFKKIAGRLGSEISRGVLQVDEGYRGRQPPRLDDIVDDRDMCPQDFAPRTMTGICPPPQRVTSFSSTACVRFQWVERINRPAVWAHSIRGIALKDSLSFRLNTVGAKVVHQLAFLLFALKPQHDRTGWRFPQFIPFEFCFECLRIKQFLLKRRKPKLQICVRDLCVGRMQSELTQGKLDVSISGRLRLLEKVRYRNDAFGNLSGCGAHFTGRTDRSGQALEIHQFLRGAQLIRSVEYCANQQDLTTLGCRR